MSTLTGVSSKGEKGKPKFQSLDINSIYNKTNKGESSEQLQTKSTVPRKHGMQSLGKVPSTRRAPVNLPSLKSEHSGSDPTVSLVPAGSTGWGSKTSDTAPPITSTSPVTTSGQTQSTNAPAVVGTAPVQPVNITPAPPLPPKPVVSTSGDKTWSSIMTGAESGSGPSFLAHQSPQFQAEFPSLPGEGGVLGPPARAGEGGYGPGPSLRPQTEGSWAHGGAAPPPTHEVQPRPINQFPPPLPSIGPQFKSVVPAFMLNRSGPSNVGFPGMFPNNFPSAARPKFPTATDNSSRPTSIPDTEDLMSRPIIREEDLNRMDEISRDSGWATQDDIDYNQKLAFSDDENGGNDDEKGLKGKSMYNVQSREERKDKENEKENRDKASLNEKLSEKGNQPWQGRSQTIPTPEFRGPLTSRLSHSNTTREMDVEEVVWKEKRRQQSNTTREMDVEEVVWKEKRRQHTEQIAAAAEKAKQRKEEEEKRFEETRSKSENEKKKKEVVECELEERRDSTETFRQMTQLESRSFPRNELYSSRFLSTIPPRFQKQNSMRQQQQSASDSRWNSPLYSSNKQKARKDSEEGKEKDDEKERRERNTPEFNDSRKDREKEGEAEWEIRRGNSAWEGMRNLEENKTSVRRDNKKSIDNFNKAHTSAFDDRDSEWRERPEVRDRPVRPDSRDSRTSRDSRISREENRSIQDNVTADYSWGDNEYDKEIQEDKPRRKETYKDDSYKERRESQAQHSRREGYVPGPITREKMEAYEHKHHMAEVIKAEKKELINSSLDNNRQDDDTWKKADSTNNTVSWADSSEECSSHQQQEQQKQGQGSSGPIQALQTNNQNNSAQFQPSQKLIVPQSRTPDVSSTHPPASNSLTDDNSIEKLVKEESISDKKKDISLNVGMPMNMAKDNKGQGGRGGGRNSRGVNRQNSYSGNYSVFYRNPRPSNKDGGNRRGSSKVGKPWNASESDASGDEVSVSTESGKEDKKSERKQAPRSPKTGERKKDKEDRIREPKKSDFLDKSNSGGITVRKPVQLHQVQPLSQQQSQQLASNTVGQMTINSQNQPINQLQQQNSFDNSVGGGGRKEGGFPPRGEPSRRGRGGFRTGGRGPGAAHYGPPGSKPAFPTPLTTNKEDEANDSSSEEKKRPLITGRKDQRKSDSDSSRSNKGKPMKIKREQDDWETSEGSDSEAKGKLPRQNKKPVLRTSGGVDKRNIFNAGQMNGRPRSEEGKAERNRLNKEDDDTLRFNHDAFHPNNGFQEVRSKKTGKDNRTVGKDDLKRGRGKEKGKGLQGGGNSKGPQGKSFQREWNNKPPRMQRMAFLQQQQNQSDPVSDMNKINQNISMFPIRDVNCSTAPAPPPPVNAWDKPITASLRTTSPAPNLHLAPPAAVPSSQEKTTIEINDHGPSGTSSQTSSPSAEKALSKIGREAVEKSFLDGTTPPVQTIVFENTNLKTPSEIALKSKFPLKVQRIDKGRDRKLDEELDDGSHMSLGNFKAGSEIKPGENKNQEPIQMPISFSKNEDNADMKLDFPFDQDLSHLTDDKSNIRPIHPVLGQNSAADLNQKIASVKKVWETTVPGTMMDHQHHDEVVSTSSSFTQNFASAVDSSLDQSSSHQVDDTTFTSDVYTTQNPSTNRANYFIIASSSQLQGAGPGYASAGANIIKQDPSNPSSNVCKVKPQPQQPVISSGIGTHSGQSLSSPSPPFTQQGHYSYQTPYNTAAIPAIPSPPVLINSGPAAAGTPQVPPSHQAEMYPFGTVINSQQPRSGFSQYPPYGLSQGLGSSSPFNQQSIYLPQAAAPPPNTADVFQSLSQYRIQPSAAAYGQSQQLSNSPSTVLITSSSNSLMSASVKSSPQPPLGAIGSKGAYQSSAHPTQVPLGYIQYDQMLTPNLFQGSQIVQRHGGNNVVPAIPPSTSYYSSSAGVGGQAGLYQPASSILAGGAGSQQASLHNATAFGMQAFNAPSATGQGQPASNNQVPSFSSQMGHFRAPAPTAPYLKAGNNAVTGQHSDPSKSPSATQDGYNSVFSSGGGGGQISSPKSRSGSNSNSAGKQAQSSQQPSPTQAQPHHKFPPYQTQPNLVMATGGTGGNQHVQSGPGGRGPSMSQGVRSGSNNGNGLGSNGVTRYPAPIQRPVVYAPGVQQQRHRVPQQSRPQPHMKIPGSYYPHQGNSVKLDVAGKDGDKLQESNNPTNKTDKKEEQVNSSDQ